MTTIILFTRLQITLQARWRPAAAYSLFCDYFSSPWPRPCQEHGCEYSFHPLKLSFLSTGRLKISPEGNNSAWNSAYPTENYLINLSGVILPREEQIVRTRPAYQTTIIDKLICREEKGLDSLPSSNSSKNCPRNNCRNL